MLFVETLGFMLLLFSIFYTMSIKVMVDSEGVTSYECGFDLLSKTRVLFSYRFFLVSILFLIFDVEIALMIPLPYYSFIKGMFFFNFFLLILFLGILFEYYNGALDWL